MAVIDISTFKSKLVGGGSRPNLYQVIINFPAYANGDTELTSFLVKASKLPASNIANIDVPYRGRMVGFAGDRSFDDWEITVYNDTTMPIRNAFERWMSNINKHNANTGLSNPRDYQLDMNVSQLDKSGTITKTYVFRNAYPIKVGEIVLSYDQATAVEEFPTTIKYDYWQDTTNGIE